MKINIIEKSRLNRLSLLGRPLCGNVPGSSSRFRVRCPASFPLFKLFSILLLSIAGDFNDKSLVIMSGTSDTDASSGAFGAFRGPFPRTFICDESVRQIISYRRLPDCTLCTLCGSLDGNAGGKSRLSGKHA